jgi:hypothetical protein
MLKRLALGLAMMGQSGSSFAQLVDIHTPCPGSPCSLVSTQTDTDRPARLTQFNRLDKTCHPLPMPEFTLLKAPAHGRIVLCPGFIKEACFPRGEKPVGARSTDVWYVPNPGFEGSDRIEFRLGNGEHPSFGVRGILVGPGASYPNAPAMGCAVTDVVS